MANAGDRRSQHLRAQVRHGSSPEEVRAYLQSRLELFSKLMFWSFVALLVFLTAMYLVYPTIVPQWNEEIFGSATILLAVMATIWRVALVRRQPSITNLYRLDIVYAIAIGCAFGGSAIGASEFRPAGYASLIYATFVVFTRAIVVPSSGRRALVVSTLIFAPVVAAGCALAVATTQDLPGPAYAIGGIVFAVIAVMLATIGSQTIFGLRQKVSEATQLGQYTLGRQIGAGGMGEVYRAQHTLLRRPTALKLLRPDKVGTENLDRFESEVQATSQLTHPNTIAIFDYGRNPDGILYYAMEYLEGIDLAKLVKTYGSQPIARVVRILAQTASALAEAHAMGFVHRDIKPANIILCERGGLHDFVKVVDFGLVVEIATDASAPGSGKHAILGTAAYLAPEAVTGETPVGPAADLYALGAVAYYLLTGRPVFDAPTTHDVALAHVTKPVVPPGELRPEIPEGLARLIVACLAKQPDARPAGALAVVAALEALAPAGDWPDATAQAWWAAFRAARTAAEAVTNDTPTQSISIDLGQRA